MDCTIAVDAIHRLRRTYVQKKKKKLTPLNRNMTDSFHGANEEDSRNRNRREADHSRQQRKAETPEQRDERLKRRREADKRRREAETPKKRRAMLDRQNAAYYVKEKFLKQRIREWKDWRRKEAVSGKDCLLKQSSRWQQD